MEDIDQLRAKAIASMSAANPNSKPAKDSVKTREEGELSSSDNDEIRAGPALVSTAIAPPAVVPNVAPVDKPVQIAAKEGKFGSLDHNARSSDIQHKTSVKQHNSKHFEMRPMPFKPGSRLNPGWHPPSVSDNNLVIRFTDNDSESDSEEQRLGFTPDKNNNRVREDKDRRPTSSHVEPKYIQQTANNQIKRLPRKGSLSRTFTSSTNKFHGNNSIGSGPLVQEVSRINTSDSFNKASARQEQRHNQGVKLLNSSELEALRQQIAIKENQLKRHRKCAQQSNSTNSILYQDHNVVHLNNNAVTKSKLASANTVSPTEPDKKRMKLADSYQSKIAPSGRQVLGPATKLVSKLKKQLPEKIGPKDGNMLTSSQCTKENSLDMIDPNQPEKNGKQIPIFSSNLVSEAKDGKPSGSSLEPIHSIMAKCKVSNKQGTDGALNAGMPMSCSRFDKSPLFMDSSPVLNRTSNFTQITSREVGGDVCQLKMPSPNKSDTDGLKVPNKFGAFSSTSLLDEAIRQHDFVQSSECNEVIPCDGIIVPLPSKTTQKLSAPARDSRFETSDASPYSISMFNPSGQISLSTHNHMNIESLLKLEELQDKDLEEAQEHRRRCEVEERNALKVYREAQRTLIEANARCTYLYRKRELFSAQFRASIMEDSSSFWSPRQHKHTERASNSLNDIPEADVNLLPTSNHQSEAEFQFINRLDHGSNMQCTDGPIFDESCQEKGRHNLYSEPCSEPDANGVCTPSNHTHISGHGDEEASPYNNRTAQSRLVCEDMENFQKGILDSNDKSKRPLCSDNAQDYALLEASLRSELFARLGTKTGSKNTDMCSSEEYTANRVEGLDERIKSDSVRGKQLSSETEQEQISDVEGNERREKGIFCSSIQNQDQSHHDNYSFGHGSQRIDDPEECSSFLAEACRPDASIFSVSSSVLKLAFSHVKVSPPSSFGSSKVKTQEKDIHEEENSLGYSEFLLGVLRARCLGSLGDMGSYTCDLSIDPFWPMCMFELRGKCNDEKCPWQHVKDYSGRNIKHDQSSNADCGFRMSSDIEKVSGLHNLSMSNQKYSMSAPQSYLAGLNLLEADSHTSGSFLLRSIGQCWQKGFSTSSGVPFTVQRNNPSDAHTFHGSDRLLGCQKQIRHNLADPEQSLEMALTLFVEEVDKLEGKKKALPVLSRALGIDPTCLSLRIVYLHIYYWDEKTIGKDDMFSSAIHDNESSYRLWLMYINSRVQLDDCLVAYESALEALCRHASAPDRDRVNVSACILDLFLQMVDCLRMSGNIGKAIQTIYGLSMTETDVSYHGSMLVSNVLTCLTVQDKCIFWVCCVYVVIYKKLPDMVVQQFEAEKELPFAIEWSSVFLTADEKQKALELMKLGVDSVACTINVGEHDREVHSLAVNHVWCVTVLEGIECGKNLLDKYIKLYPTCIELVLASSRFRRNYFGDVGCEGFEDALHNWPREVPGIQCIWNQYVQCVLENGDCDFARKLMVRWSSFEKVDCPQIGKLGDGEDGGSDSSPESPSPKLDAFLSSSNPKDELFGLLNLSLHNLLQENLVEARMLVDKALNVASSEDLKHCVKEHAVFVSTNVSELVDASSSGVLNLLNRYLVDVRFLPVPELLSRKFCQEIKSSKTRQLINNLLGPISCDYTVVNSILKACYGPSLLPDSFGELKYLVDLVETLMELFPTNYWLALSACKLILKNSNTSVASASVVFWVSTLLVYSLCQAFPVAPEHVWVEAADTISNLVKAHVISERFHQQAVSVYPFSVKLWKSWHNLSKLTGNGSSVVAAARGRGIKLD